MMTWAYIDGAVRRLSSQVTLFHVIHVGFHIEPWLLPLGPNTLWIPVL